MWLATQHSDIIMPSAHLEYFTYSLPQKKREKNLLLSP